MSCCLRAALLAVLQINAFAFSPAPGVPRTGSFLGATISDRTRAYFEAMDTVSGQAMGAGGSSSLVGLERLDESWARLRSGGWAEPPAQIVFERDESSPVPIDFDVAVCGGTLGVFYAAVMQIRGHRCVVIERGKVEGRRQEWNIARKEIDALVRANVLTPEELQSCIAIQFNPVRVGFNTDTSEESKKTFNMFTTDVLNLGVSPLRLIELVKQKFIAAGGVVMEQSALERIDVYKNGAAVGAAGKAPVTARIVLDCMGNGSPIAKQIRGVVEPDGVCIVVGTCARGFDAANNTYSDLIYTDTPVTRMKSGSSLQYFWEAFPTGGDKTERTTYLFAYMDAKKERASVGEIFDDYWDLLPRYQGKQLKDLALQRVLYGLFPTYRASPLRTTCNRVLQVGDASGIQSPLSFGGFGSLTRHLDRVCGALEEALSGPAELLLAENLAAINAYQPNLACCWMFQRAMSVPVGREDACPPDLVVSTLSNSFSAMEKLGETVMRPFLQDVLQFQGLLRTLVKAAGQDLLTPLKIVPHVGVVAMLDFVWHFGAMALYTSLHQVLGQGMLDLASGMKTSAPVSSFRLRRMAEGWKFGSGLDYYDHE